MSRRVALLGVLAVILVACASLPAHAWPHDPSQNQLVCDATGPQGHPSMVHMGEPGTYVVWSDYRAGMTPQTFAQRLNVDGLAAWDPGGIPVTDTLTYQSQATVHEGPDNSCYVTWMDARTGTWRVMAQRLDMSSIYHWDPNGIFVCSDTTGQFGPEAVSDGSGGLVVVWGDERGGEFTSDIYAQRLDPMGNPLWDAAGVAVCADSATYQTLMGVAADGEGGAFVTWSDNRAGPDSADLYISHLTSAGYVVWSAGGVLVCDAPGWQTGDGLVADGDGGAYVVWRDERSSLIRVYAQRIDQYGIRRWGDSGVPVSPGLSHEYGPSIVDNDDPGIIVTWLDSRASAYERDIYAQRLDPWGNAVWDTLGVPVCTYGTYMDRPELVSDGAGGVTAAWVDNRPGSTTDIYAQRLDADGNRLWDEDGVAVSTQSGPQENLAAVTDGAGGIIAAWRLGQGENEEGDVYAQRLERNGYLGFPAPAIYEVVDYPDDQGGVAVVSWNRSYLDQYPNQVVTHYSLWRKMPDLPPEERSVDTRSVSLEVGLPIDVVAGFSRSGWSYVDDIPASYWPGYGYDAPTYGDSTAAGVPVTEYMVVAQTADQWVFWESHLACGYSVDNLAPGAPLALSAQVVATDVELEWTPAGWHDEDLSHYNVYRSGASGFTPGPGTFVGAASDTFYTDVQPGYGTWYYLVAGEDVHGNVGDPSNEASSTQSGVEEMPERFALRGCRPNPFNPATTIVYDVPEPGGEVTIRLFDIGGRLVRTLREGIETPGRKSTVWRGADDAGRPLPSGVYFCRMTATDYEKSIKLTLLK
jgi:hypothetical protein